MEDLSLHILDIVENSVSSGATKVEITIVEDIENDLLTIDIRDNGMGMDKETLKKAEDPFFTTKTTRRIGLGIPLLAAAAREASGDLKITSQKGKGTHLRAHFKHSHIDRKPLGDIQKTLEALIIGNPGVDFTFEHRKGDEVTRIDTATMGKGN